MTSKFVVLLPTDLLNVRIAYTITQVKLARRERRPPDDVGGHVIRKHAFSIFFVGGANLA